jgi:hypothetical protein
LIQPESRHRIISSLNIRLFPHASLSTNKPRLGDQRGGSCRVILESRGDLLPGLVVPRETVDTRLDQDEPELGVTVLPVGLEVLADGNRLFDEVPEVLRDGWAKSYPQTKRLRANAKKRKKKAGGV